MVMNNQHNNLENKTKNLNDSLDWANDQIVNYLDYNQNNLPINEGYNLSYLSIPSIRNERKYAMVKIGFNKEAKFFTEKIIFIDSLTKDIFEYDVENDALILWNPKLLN